MKTRISALSLALLLGVVIASGCTLAIAETPETPTVVPTESPPESDGEPVVGWVGVVVDLPPGNQFGQIFEREDGEEFGIATPTEVVREQVVEARSTRTRVKVWGTLYTGAPADQARTIEVDWLEFLSEQSTDEGEPVEGWTGRMIDLPAGNQFGQTFEREDGEEFGIATPTEAVRDQIVEARSTGARMKVWGTLYTGVPADEARTIEVERLEFLSEPPADDGELVEGWIGTVYQLPPGNQFGRSFIRDDGEEYGIGTTDDALRDRINEAAWVGARIKVWGTLHTGVPATEARQIEVTRLEVLSEAAAEPRYLSPFAQLSASSHLSADRYGTYGPYAAIDGSKETSWVEGVAGPGIGEWVQFTFPGTIELHALGFDVGFDKDADLFVKNNRIKKATLIFSNGEQTRIEFEDTRGMQEFAMVRAPGPNVETTSIKIIIEDVYPGTEYDDTCLAEIEVWGVTK